MPSFNLLIVVQFCLEWYHLKQGDSVKIHRGGRPIFNVLGKINRFTCWKCKELSSIPSMFLMVKVLVFTFQVLDNMWTSYCSFVLATWQLRKSVNMCTLGLWEGFPLLWWALSISAERQSLLEKRQGVSPPLFGIQSEDFWEKNYPR